MLEKYFSFRGRLNRKPYWLRTILVSLATIVVILAVVFGFSELRSAFEGAIAGTGDLFENAPVVVGLVILALVVIAATVSTVSIALRRLHDRDKSGWWLLLFYVVPNFLSGDNGLFGSPDSGLAIAASLVGLAISIWGFVEIGILRGTDGPNRYGDDPLEETNADVFA